MTTANSIFDARAVRANRVRSASFGRDALFLHAQVAEGLIDRRLDIARTFDHAAILGGRGLMTAADLKAGNIIEIDSAPGLLSAPGGICDFEALALREGHFDAVFSLLCQHNIDDLPGSLIQINRALKPDGLFMAAVFSLGTLGVLKDAFLTAEMETTGAVSPRVAPFVDVRDAGALLQRAGFVMPVADTDDIIIRYGDPLTLLRDLRAMGEANALAERSRRFLRKDTFLHLLAALEAFRDEDGKIPVQFNIAYMTGWAPGPNQPRPLAPGSAKNRLADELGSQEVVLKGG